MLLCLMELLSSLSLFSFFIIIFSPYSLAYLLLSITIFQIADLFCIFKSVIDALYCIFLFQLLNFSSLTGSSVSSLLKFSLRSSALPSSQVNIFMTILSSVSGVLLISILVISFVVIFVLFFHVEHTPLSPYFV